MSTTPRVGTEMAGYRIEALIGRGGMSVVYLAEHMRLGRKIALKVLSPELVEDDAFRERFIRESRLAASLDHPNVIPIYDAGDADGLLYIAMRYVDGSDLRAMIHEGARPDPERTIGIVQQVAGALDAAHAAGLVHRDVKPGNILVAARTGGGSDKVFLTDFGLVKLATGGSGPTRTGQFVGTLDYVSPEQVQGHTVDHRADIYSLGCVTYETLTGRPPFKREDEVAVMWAHVRDDPPKASEFDPRLPAALDPVFAKAMAKEPDDRYASAGEFVRDAAAALASAGARPGVTGPAAGAVGATVVEAVPPHAPVAQASTSADPPARRTTPPPPVEPVPQVPPGPAPGPPGAPPPGGPPPGGPPPPGGGNARSRTPLVVALAIGLGVIVLGGIAFWFFSRDTSPPTVALSGQPSSGTSTSASFRFRSSDPDATFECELDGAGFEDCDSPQTYSGLSVGSHTFHVRASDAAGNVSGPEVSTFTIEAPPEEPITDGDDEVGTTPEEDILQSQAPSSLDCDPSRDKIVTGFEDSIGFLVCTDASKLGAKITVQYSLYATLADMRREYDTNYPSWDIERGSGSCQQFTDVENSWGPTGGGPDEGRLFCYRVNNPRRSVIQWTTDATLTYAYASSQGYADGAIYRWWRFNS